MRSIASIISLLIFATGVAAETSTNALLTNVISVLVLPSAQAWGHNVHLRGVVTAAQASTALQPNWDGGFFMQDDTAGIYVVSSNRLSPQPGDLVEVTGISHPGGFAPFVSDAQWAKLGTAPLPAANSPPIEQLMTGSEDGQRVQITCVIRSFVEDKPVVMYEVTSGGYHLKVYAPTPPDVNPQALIGAKVRVRGTASTLYSGLLRQLISVELHVPFASDFVIEKKQPEDPFLSPVVPINNLSQYRRDHDPGEQFHIKGTVTYQRRGLDLFLQDANRGIQVSSRRFLPVEPGEIVEAVGFLEFDNFLPVLADATFRKTQETPVKVEPQVTAISELQAGFRHAEMIRLQGRAVNYVERQNANNSASEGETRSILTLQNDGVMFTVESFSPESNQALSRIPIGSTVEVDGICFMSIADDGKLKGLQVLLPGASGVRILKKPDWLTPHRLIISLACLLVLSAAAVFWSVMTEKRNVVLSGLVREKERAQAELQQANEHLEERVRERTNQLKFQITARQESEVQFKGTLIERTRLAQELHDTLEQTLTGIALQLDTAAKLFQAKPDTANHHLELARDMVGQSQVEVRRSIWDLRSRALEQFDLSGALAASGQQLTESLPIQLKVTTKGLVRPLPETVEDNLLRIGQEAMTNVIKHSQATAAEIQLCYGPKKIILRIHDNGRGFDHKQPAGPGEGHFGLQGISERAKRLKAKLTIKSESGKGTLVMVQVDLSGESHPLDSSEL